MAKRRKALPEVTAANYYSPEMNMAYMGASQFKTFCECEARGLAEARGEWTRGTTDALLVGGYVDAYFSDELEDYQREHPGIFTQGGKLRAAFVAAHDVITRAEMDPLFHAMLWGEMQAIRTGTIGGVPFKIKVDSLLSARMCEAICKDFPEMEPHLYMADGAIVDLKVMRDFKPSWREGEGRVSFARKWQYDLQLAIYQAIEGRGLPCFIAAATKQEPPDLALLYLRQEHLDEELRRVEELAGRFDAVKRGKAEAARCGRCAYCRGTKVLAGAVDYWDYGMEDDEA